jgi:hypothetical protein
MELKITKKANQLSELRAKIKEIENQFNAILDPLKDERDATQDELIKEMTKNKMASIRVESGETYIKSSRKSLEITNDLFALNWAKENYAISVNKTEAMKKLKDMEKLPQGFEITETEFISIRSAKPEEAK